MSAFEVQGVVSSETGEPLVQFRQVDDEGNTDWGCQVPIMEAREIATNIVEAAANATYEAALIAWAKDRDPASGENIGAMMVGAVRRFRSDKWGLPSMPSDWSTGEDDGTS